MQFGPNVIAPTRRRQCETYNGWGARKGSIPRSHQTAPMRNAQWVGARKRNIAHRETNPNPSPVPKTAESYKTRKPLVRVHFFLIRKK